MGGSDSRLPALPDKTAIGPTRFLWKVAMAVDTMPPMDSPQMVVLSGRFSASKSTMVSFTMPWMVCEGGHVDSPWPQWSKIITSWSFDKDCTMSRGIEARVEPSPRR